MLPKLYFVVFALSVFGQQIKCDVYQDYQVVSTTEKSDQKDNATIILELLLELHKQQNEKQQEKILNEFEQIRSKLEIKITKLSEAVQRHETKLQEMSEKITQLQSQEKMKINKTGVRLYPKNCKQIQDQGYSSGVYRIQPSLEVESFDVLCDTKTNGGGWAYLLNRFDGSQNFYMNWENYKNGFGKLNGEFWIGLERLYQLTKSEPMELLIELVDWKQEKRYAFYKTFEIGSEQEGYSLKTLSDYSGDAGNSMFIHIGRKFSTYDKDQDLDSNGSCASYWKGAWWYRACSNCALTETYKKGSGSKTDGEGCMYWSTFHPGKENYCLKQARMMIRPRSNRA